MADIRECPFLSQLRKLLNISLHLLSRKAPAKCTMSIECPRAHKAAGSCPSHSVSCSRKTPEEGFRECKARVANVCASLYNFALPSLAQWSGQLCKEGTDLWEAFENLICTCVHAHMVRPSHTRKENKIFPVIEFCILSIAIFELQPPSACPPSLHSVPLPLPPNPSSALLTFLSPLSLLLFILPSLLSIPLFPLLAVLLLIF